MKLLSLSDKDLLRFNKQGVIPGPDENELEYISRVDCCLHLHEALKGGAESELRRELGQQIPYEAKITTTQEYPDILAMTESLFDISATWMPIFFSNRSLAPWHGGCAWFFQLSEKAPMIAFFQLRENFAKAARYLKIYDRRELIAHESAHVGRMMFQEPKFEEILAYRTAISCFRRWFGPVVQSTAESLLFLISLFIFLSVQFLFVFMERSDSYHLTLWAGIFPIVLLGIALIRLWIRQRIFLRCLKHLTALLKDSRKANAVIYRLQDEEIIAFSKLSKAEIVHYVDEKNSQSLRWHLIDLAYFQRPRNDR